MTNDKSSEKNIQPPYMVDFTKFVNQNPSYLTLNDDTARFIINTMEQMTDGRDSSPYRPDHYPFPQLDKQYFFQGQVVHRERQVGQDARLTEGDSIRLMIVKRGFGGGDSEIAVLEGIFQQTGDVVQSAFVYTNTTDKLPREQQIHNAFAILLPYRAALCQVIANYEQKPVIDIVRLQNDKPHWKDLLAKVGYEFQNTAYVYQYEPMPPATGTPHEVSPVRR